MSKAECKIIAGEPHWELQALLRTLITNWPTLFQNVLPQSARGHAFELKEFRNQVAHEHDMTLDDAIRLLDTAVRLLKSVGAPEATELEQMWINMLQIKIAGSTAQRSSSPRSTVDVTSRLVPAARRTRTADDADDAPPWQPCMDRVADHLGTEFNRRRGRCAFSADRNYAVCCLVSKLHPNGRYWWTLHQRQLEAISSSPNALVAFACGSPDTILLIPAQDIEPWLTHLNPKTVGDEEGWHIHIQNDGDDWRLLLKGRGQRITITERLIS